MGQQKLGWIDGVRGSRAGFRRTIVAVALAGSTLASAVGGVAAAQASEDCRAPRLATNVQDFGSPFAASMAAAVADDGTRSRRDTNSQDFGAPAPGR